MPTPIATSRASLSGFVHTTTCDPNEIWDRLDGTNWTIGTRGETEMRTVLSPIKFTVSTRPGVPALFETIVPFVILVLVSAGVSGGTAKTDPLVMLVSVTPDVSTPEVSGRGSQG